jgi:hypothetical protein
MGLRKTFGVLGAALICFSLLYAQRPFREYPGQEYENFPMPPDWQEKTEWVFARLMFPSAPTARSIRWRGGRVNWLEGYTSWTNDYPRADRHFVAVLRRFTSIHARSVEQPVNLDDGNDVFRYPFLYAVKVGEWDLTDAQAAKLREYLLRGGFFMGDDFWGDLEWSVFEKSMRKVFPARPIVDIPDGDAIFHVVYDLTKKQQVPPEPTWVRTGSTTKCYGCRQAFKGIYDEDGRLMVAVCFNSDFGDSWEHADNPRYPEEFTGFGLRLGTNFVVYSMTH